MQKFIEIYLRNQFTLILEYCAIFIRIILVGYT